MRFAKLWMVLLLVAGQLVHPAYAGADGVFWRAEVSMAFGSQTQHEPWMVRLGVTAKTFDELGAISSGQTYLPVSGLLIEAGTGLTPLLLGARLGPLQPSLNTQAEEESSHWYSRWGWIAAALLVAGTVAAAAGDSGGASNPNDGPNTSNGTINIVSNDTSSDNCTIVNPETQTIISGNCM